MPDKDDDIGLAPEPTRPVELSSKDIRVLRAVLREAREKELRQSEKHRIVEEAKLAVIKWAAVGVSVSLLGAVLWIFQAIFSAALSAIKLRGIFD